MPRPKNDPEEKENEPVDPLKHVKGLVKSVEEMPTKALDTVKKAPGKALKKAKGLVGLQTGGMVESSGSLIAKGLEGNNRYK